MSFVNHWSMHFVPVAEPPDSFGPPLISMGTPVEPERLAMPQDWPVHFCCAVDRFGRSVRMAMTTDLVSRAAIAEDASKEMPAERMAVTRKKMKEKTKNENLEERGHIVSHYTAQLNRPECQ